MLRTEVDLDGGARDADANRRIRVEVVSEDGASEAYVAGQDVASVTLEDDVATVR